MTQSRYSVLLSFCLLILLTAGFFEASRLVFNKIHSSVAAAIATATPIVLVPTATPVHPKATAGPSKRHHAHAAPTATEIPSAVPVIVSTSLNDPVGSTTFALNTGTLYCKVNLPNLPLDTPITFKWASLPSGEVIFPYTSTYASPLKYTYFSSSLAPGRYECQISAPQNGQSQILGTAYFSVK